MSTFSPAKRLRQHRPVLLACEAIGWLHMAGKARIEFLRGHGGDRVDYDDRKWHDAEQPPFPWDDLTGWVKTLSGSTIPQDAWPSSMKKFTEKHRDQDPGIVGLLQAGHGVVSGIEKNLPSKTSGYLGQSFLHMWLSSPFGHPKRNLSADPPEILTERGWSQLVAEMRRVLEEQKALVSQEAVDVEHWRLWRDKAIGPGSYIRKAFLSTLAETRLPNNDVTLWDQSYVAAALFKSALAGAILNLSFPWKDKEIKQKTRWRLLTVAIGADHYEARAVKIGDWTGTRAKLDEFFQRIAEFIEVDIAVGSLLYLDSSVAIFSFPGERFDESVPASWLHEWEGYLQQEVDRIAESFHLETPPLVRLSSPTRSLVPMVQERREVARVLAIPVHRPWSMSHRVPEESGGHVCPVCQVRLNGDPTNKGTPCKVCWDRRHHRLRDWLHGGTNYGTIWFEEVADRNNRIALLTLSLDLEPWLDGQRVDSLRAQAIPEWLKFNPTLRSNPALIAPRHPWENLSNSIKSKLSRWDPNDPVLANLQEGFKHHKGWEEFFERIVEDRSDAPRWNSLGNDQRAAWLVHQLFRRLPSPGRVYRFWREAQDFFESLLKEFRQIAASSNNPWRVRRLLIELNSEQHGQSWQDGTLYNAHFVNFRQAPLSLVYVQALKGFVTTSNLARLLKPEEERAVLQGKTIHLEEADAYGRAEKMVIDSVKWIPFPYSHLGLYHPVLPLEVSPLRFRILVPLEAASDLVELALNRWKEAFASVWDRLPLHIGVVAFERTVSFQAVLEGTRYLEEALTGSGKEVWQVVGKEARDGVLTLQLRRQDGQVTVRTMPYLLPDGREDVFYPYLHVKGQGLRFPRDFRHPEGTVYRYAADLQFGDSVEVTPSRLATLTMHSTASRFEDLEVLYVEDWQKIRGLWRFLLQVAPSQTAIRRFYNALSQLKQAWLDGHAGVSIDPTKDGLWKDTVKALLAEYLGVKGISLETLAEAIPRGLLEHTLRWHLDTLNEAL